MPSLIVIRIVPPQPVKTVNPDDFEKFYLNPSIGPLQITAFELSFNDPTVGKNLGTVKYVPAASGPSPTKAQSLPQIMTSPQYSSAPASGIVRNYGLEPSAGLNAAYFLPAAVATAVIKIPAAAKIENLRLVAQWGSGAGATPVPINQLYYDVQTSADPAPNLNAWAPLDSAFIHGNDPWLDLAPSAYLHLPAAPSSSKPFSFAIPTNGTPPPFDDLLAAVKQIFALDPGTSPNLGAMSAEQCRNIAYEIVWTQRPPPPQPPEPLDDMYSTPPNTGTVLSGSPVTPNQHEGNRQQFEATLMSYYALADMAADRLTGFVYSLSAAIACEQRSLAATRAMLELPANSAAAGGGPVSGHEIILTGFADVDPPTNFGVPAAYFYGLAAQLPPQIGADKRFELASSDRLERLLADLTSAIEAGTITDKEAFVGLSPTAINAAKAARRIAALGIPTSSSAPLAPLGARRLQTSSATPSGKKLQFPSTGGLVAGMLVSGSNIPVNTKIASLTPTEITLSAALLGNVAAGSSIYLAPVYPAALSALIKSWLAFPPDIPATLSSRAYLATDDAEKFWPIAQSAPNDAYLNFRFPDPGRECR